MLKPSAFLTALLSLSFPPTLQAGDDLAAIRAEIQQLKTAYEARIQALEQRLQAAEAAKPMPNAAQTASNALNPEVSLVLSGTYTRLSQDPTRYRLQGFMPIGDERGPGKRSFSLGESELTLNAAVDPMFSGKLTFALAADNSVSVEEAAFQSQGWANGLNLSGGRFLSALGYLNSQHTHAWDFVDAPLVYQTMFGGQYKTDGAQLKWLAPSERFIELGLEAGNGQAAPGNDRNKNGAGAVAAFARMGDDWGNASWLASLSALHTGATARSYNDPLNGLDNTFSGKTKIWNLSGVLKWAPLGNASRTHFKLQGEYFHRREQGTLATDGLPALAYLGQQSGGYLQGVYQFVPAWRVGLRYDRLNSGSSGLSATDFPLLASYRPSRVSVMVDYSPTEFSRLRLQWAQDKSRPEVTDQQLFLQYIMNLGVHGAHSF